MDDDEWLGTGSTETEIVVFCGMRRRKGGGFQMRGVDIAGKAMATYLGITLDKHLIFGCHVKETCVKAERVAAALSRLLPNIKEPNAAKRKVFANAVVSILLHGAPVWSEVLRMDKYRQRLSSV